MKDKDDKEGEESVKATVKEVRAPGKDDNGVIGDGDHCDNEDDHEIAQELEAGA